MAFRVSISSTNIKGFLSPSTIAHIRAIRLLRDLRHTYHLPQQHTIVAYVDSSLVGLIWVVDSGSNRHFSVVASDFTNLVLSNDLGNVSGINCTIVGTLSISFLVRERSGKLVPFLLTNVLFVPYLASRSRGNYLRLMSVQLANKARYTFIF
jgi:hypothetical protein